MRVKELKNILNEWGEVWGFSSATIYDSREELLNSKDFIDWAKNLSDRYSERRDHFHLSKNDERDLQFSIRKIFQSCKGCTEKSEFIKKIEEVKPKYVKDEL